MEEISHLIGSSSVSDLPSATGAGGSTACSVLPIGKEYHFFGCVITPFTLHPSLSDASLSDAMSHTLHPSLSSVLLRSHQKDHSVYGEISEALGIRIKDVMEGQFGLKGWFDLVGDLFRFKPL